MAHKSVLLADDHLMFAEGIKSLLSENYRIVGIVEDGTALIQQSRVLKPDIIISDISMPIMNGLNAAEQILAVNDDVKIVFLTMHSEVSYVMKALDIGVHAYVLKHSNHEELFSALEHVQNNRTYLSPVLTMNIVDVYKNDEGNVTPPLELLRTRQLQVLQLLVESYSAKEIANILNVSSRTVEFHKYKMVEVLKLNSASELVPFAIKNGLVKNL